MVDVDPVGQLPRARLASLPTPLEHGPLIAGRNRLWVKRDDLTGLGGGGNKARKLEYLCGRARADGVGALVTVGASQSNHCRLTAAAGAVLGLDVHLVLAGERPSVSTGNPLLSMLFGAQLHYTGAPESHWGELAIAAEALLDELAADGVTAASIPIGGSTAVGAVGYAGAFEELMQQCRAIGIEPAAVVHASSSGGTHAGLLAGRAVWRARHGGPVPEVVAIGVAKGVNLGLPNSRELAAATLQLLGESLELVGDDDVAVDPRWIGDDYAVPTDAGDAAIVWAARHGGWVLDRVYTGKGLAGLLGNAAEGRWREGSDIVFVHTGGFPAVFAPGGAPPLPNGPRHASVDR